MESGGVSEQVQYGNLLTLQLAARVAGHRLGFTSHFSLKGCCMVGIITITLQ